MSDLIRMRLAGSISAAAADLPGSAGLLAVSLDVEADVAMIMLELESSLVSDRLPCHMKYLLLRPDSLRVRGDGM